MNKQKEATHTAPEWMQKEGIAKFWKKCGYNWLALMQESDDNPNLVWVLTERKTGQGFVEKLEKLEEI